MDVDDILDYCIYLKLYTQFRIKEPAVSTRAESKKMHTVLCVSLKLQVYSPRTNSYELNKGINTGTAIYFPGYLCNLL